MAFWEIEHRPGLATDGNRRSVEDWGATIASRRLASLAADVVSIAVPSDPVDEVETGTGLVTIASEDVVETIATADPILGDTEQWEYGDTLIVYRNNVRWFEGVVTKRPRQGTAQEESRTFEISGPWWFLENTVYQQGWQELDVAASTTEAVLAQKFRSRVLLGMDEGGVLIKTGAQIEAILNYCLQYSKAGGETGVDRFSVGTVLTGQKVWAVDIRDQTCAEVVRSILRWHPNAVSSWDYSQSPPQLTIDVPSATTSVDLVSSDLVGASFNPRNDLVPPSVSFIYERNRRWD